MHLSSVTKDSNSNFKSGNYNYNVADIISNSIKYSRNYLIINKGSNDSVKLDLKCIQKGKGHPLYDSHEYIVINELENVETHKTNDIDDLLVKSNILHGKLSESVKLAEDPKSELGKGISKLEKKEIMEAIKNLEMIRYVSLKINLRKTENWSPR